MPIKISHLKAELAYNNMEKSWTMRNILKAPGQGPLMCNFLSSLSDETFSQNSDRNHITSFSKLI